MTPGEQLFGTAALAWPATQWPRRPWPSRPVRDERWLARRLRRELEERTRGPYGLAGLVTIEHWAFACGLVGQLLGCTCSFRATRGSSWVTVWLGIECPPDEVHAAQVAFDEVAPESVNVVVLRWEACDGAD